MSASSNNTELALANSGIRKAAVLMVSLGVEASASLLRQLEPREIELLSIGLSNLGTVSSVEAATTLQEFEEKLSRREVLGYGGAGYAKRILTGAFGEDFARQMEQRLQDNSAIPSAPLARLSSVDPELLARILEAEHPQSIAVLAAYMPPLFTSRVFARFEADYRHDVLTRMAALENTDPDVASMIAASVLERAESASKSIREPARGIHLAAELINHLPAEIGAQLLDSVGDRSPELASSIRRLLFIFDDILKLDPKAMRELVSRLDRKLLVIGLKGTSDEVRQHFLGTMSKSGAAMLLEDMEAAGPVRIREVESAQQQIISYVRQMEDDGVIDLRSAGSEQYVV
jgi:flagellar motor switch protein FliG